MSALFLLDQRLDAFAPVDRGLAGLVDLLAEDGEQRPDEFVEQRVAADQVDRFVLAAAVPVHLVEQLADGVPLGLGRPELLRRVGPWRELPGLARGDALRVHLPHHLQFVVERIDQRRRNVDLHSCHRDSLLGSEASTQPSGHGPATPLRQGTLSWAGAEVAASVPRPRGRPTGRRGHLFSRGATVARPGRADGPQRATPA